MGGCLLNENISWGGYHEHICHAPARSRSSG